MMTNHHFECRQCRSTIQCGPEPTHRTCRTCHGCTRHQNKLFCTVCKTFSKKDKFHRDHEMLHGGDQTRCTPGRVADRTKKWTEQETATIAEALQQADVDLQELLTSLNEGLDMDRRHPLASLERKVEYLRGLGKVDSKAKKTEPLFRNSNPTATDVISELAFYPAHMLMPYEPQTTPCYDLYFNAFQSLPTMGGGRGAPLPKTACLLDADLFAAQVQYLDTPQGESILLRGDDSNNNL